MAAELELHRPATELSEQMDYAKAVSDGSLLPEAYRKKPANVLIAIGLGSAMGLTPAESLYRIDVIGGKPTASAELIAANVRKAGHKLRVRGDEHSATAQIIRADDPDYVFEVTRDMDWAQRMGLASRDQYKKQPGTMLQYRAITAVARLACPEALYGIAYTADEISDFPAATQQSTTGLASALAAQAEPEPPAAVEPTEPEPATYVQPITEAQMRKMHAAFNDLGITERQDRLDYTTATVNREVRSSTELTKDEASTVIDKLQRLIDEAAGNGDQP